MKHLSKKNNSNKKQRAVEISVAAAAQILNVTERTVLNFIKTKQIQAVKVGKSWFVDEASVKAYAVSLPVSENSEGVSEKSGRFSEKLPPLSERNKKSKSHAGVGGLNCYKLAVEIFREPLLGLGAQATPFEHNLHVRVAQLQIKVLEHLGAGYHTYGAVKVAEYGKARAAAGSLLALFHSGVSGLPSDHVRLLEEKLLPCLVALQRSAEKTRATKMLNQK